MATVDLCKTQVTSRNVSKIPQTGTFHPQNRLNDSQIDKVHSLSFFCVVSSDFAGQRQRKNTGRATSTTVWAENLQNFAKFLPLPNFAHLPASGMLKFGKRIRAKPKISAIARLNHLKSLLDFRHLLTMSSTSIICLRLTVLKLINN